MSIFANHYDGPHSDSAAVPADTDDSQETCPACGDSMPESCAGPSGRHQPIAAAVPDPRFRDQPTREDRAVAAGLVRRARAAMSDDERDAVVEAIAREIASERAAALAEVEARVQAAVNQRAAEELEDAAADIMDQHGTASLAAKRLRARAAALASPAPAPRAEEGQR